VQVLRNPVRKREQGKKRGGGGGITHETDGEIEVAHATNKEGHFVRKRDLI
jgi:hypothetical protein